MAQVSLIEELLSETSLGNKSFVIDAVNATTTTLEYPKRTDQSTYGQFSAFFGELKTSNQEMDIIDM